MTTFWLFMILLQLIWNVSPSHAACTLNRKSKIAKNYKCEIKNKGYWTFQEDGNMVIYDQRERAKWHTSTDHKGDSAIFQDDGNLVIYNREKNVLWSSGTKGKGHKLTFHDNRNLAIYDKNGNSIWTSETGIDTFVLHVDTANATDLDEYARRGKELIEREVKRVSRFLNYPDYEAPTSVKLYFNPVDRGIFASGNYIEIAADWPRKTDSKDFGVFIHEFTHVVQWHSYSDCPGWVVEGVADYVRRFMYQIPNDSPPVLPKDSERKWENGYTDAAYFMDWIHKNYGVDMVTALNRNCQQKKFDNEIFKKLTGKDARTLWDEMIHQFDYLK